MSGTAAETTIPVMKSRRRICRLPSWDYADDGFRRPDYSKDLRPAKWDSGVTLQSINPEPLMSESGAAAAAAIRHLKTSQWERERLQDRAARTKAALTAAALPVMHSPSHIVPVFV